jgi:membrane protein implicated in regulation of membrane protease activity
MTPVITATPPVRATPANVASDNQGTIAGLRSRHAKPGRDSVGIWLYAAAVRLFTLVGSAAVVSFSAQRRLVYAARRLAVAAAPGTAIPAAVLVFACLGVALALPGRPAIRGRLIDQDRSPGRGDPEAGL